LTKPVAVLTFGPFMHFLRFLLVGLAFLVASLAILWTAGALYFDLPAPGALRTLAAIAWALGAAALGIFGGGRGQIALLLGLLVIAAWWSTLRPRLDRDWQPQVAMLAYATRDGDRLTVHNIRDFDYRTATDFTPRYETRIYDLANLRALHLFVNYWGSQLMAHPILSFDFGPQGHLCFSIETRPPRGKAYSTIGGLYRQFELIYIAADERDVIRLRTNIKGEDIYLYRLTVPPDEVRIRLMEYVDRLNELHVRPVWYNAITANCTTSIRTQSAADHRLPLDWRILLNGYGDEMLYERHALAGRLPFAELKKRALIDDRARAADDATDFSDRIRAGLPGFDAPLQR
jgi:hypothetical protein